MSQLEDRAILLLRQLFKDLTLKREVPVQDLFPSYPSGRDKYDIVIPALNIIVETHGAQHKRMVSYGGKSDIEASYKRLVRQKRKDHQKEEVALENGWSYIVIWYHELTGDDEKDLLTLREKLREANSESEPGT